MTLPEAITDALPPDDNLRMGVVATVHPLTVNVQGTPVPAGALSSYTPIVGDPVALFRQDSTWLCLGRTTSPVTGSFPQFEAGTADITVAAATSGSVAVVFAIPFRTLPAVATNINSGSGSVGGWISRAIGITTTGFTISISGAINSFTVPVQWQAQEMTQ
jgi:hypothetical protein